MGHDWILDVLTDLKTYAQMNGLPALAVQLDDTALVAEAEIASPVEGKTFGIPGKHAAPGRLDRTAGIS